MQVQCESGADSPKVCISGFNYKNNAFVHIFQLKSLPKNIINFLIGLHPPPPH